MTGSSSAKESCRSTLLKRWMLTEMRWKRNADSLSSPDTDEMRRPSTFRNSMAEVLRAPRFSTAIGWKMWFCWRSMYLTDFLSAACSATRPDSLAATLWKEEWLENLQEGRETYYVWRSLWEQQLRSYEEDSRRRKYTREKAREIKFQKPAAQRTTEDEEMQMLHCEGQMWNVHVVVCRSRTLLICKSEMLVDLLLEVWSVEVPAEWVWYNSPPDNCTACSAKAEGLFVLSFYVAVMLCQFLLLLIIIWQLIISVMSLYCCR